MVSEDGIDSLIKNLEDGMHVFESLDIERENIGIVAGPYYSFGDDHWKIEINVRSMQEDIDVDLDMEYSFEGLNGGQVLDDIYPEFIEKVEERYGDTQLQYLSKDV